MVTIAVLADGLTGLAAAARLAKSGHRVLLLPTALVGTDPVTARVTVPTLIDLPAAWRDLFVKSGRPLAADLARAGLDLRPAPPVHHVFGNGSTLDLPTDRGEQFAAIRAGYTTATATAWRDLLDTLEDAWQALRACGVESAVSPAGLAALDAAVPPGLRPSASLAALARRAPAPLNGLVTATADDLGLDPSRAPWWVAVVLVVHRTFGRWQLWDTAADAPADPSLLLAVLRARAETRKVEIVDSPVIAVAAQDDAVTVATVAGTLRADAAVVTHDPWTTATLLDIAPPSIAGRLRPRPAPRVETDSGPWPGLQPGPARRSVPSPPPDTGRVVLAGMSGPLAPEPWAQVLTGALATYAVHRIVTGDDIRPVNLRTHRPRG